MVSLTNQSKILTEIRAAGWGQLDPVDTSDPDDFLLDLISSCFQPVTHFRNPMIMDLRPKRWMDPSSYAGFARVPMHTDRAYVPRPPRYIVMMCVVPDEGGDPEVADGGEALAMLDEDVRRELHERQFDFRQAADSSCVGFSGPILTPEKIRFRRDLLPWHAGSAVAQFARALRRCTRRLVVQPGSIWIVDNYRVLHGRTALRRRNASKRHFKRMYAEDR